MSNLKKTYNILKVKDKNEKFYSTKETISDLPARILIIGKSQLSGKTNFLCNILGQENFYLNDFKGEKIFLISGSVKNDNKLQNLIECKEIEHQNIYSHYDEELLEAIYDMIQEEFEENIENKKQPENYLMIFDDMSFSGIFKGKNFGVINKMFSNGRHINLSVIVTAQKYSDIMTSARENMTLGIFFNCSDKQLDLITDDINYITTKKNFKKKFRETTREKHSFFVVNFTNKPDEMYLNKNFEPINMDEEDNLKPALKNNDYKIKYDNISPTEQNEK